MLLLRKNFESWFCGEEASVPSLSKGDLFPFLKKIFFFTEMWAIAAGSASVEEFDHYRVFRAWKPDLFTHSMSHGYVF